MRDGERGRNREIEGERGREWEGKRGRERERVVIFHDIGHVI